MSQTESPNTEAVPAAEFDSAAPPATESPVETTAVGESADAADGDGKAPQAPIVKENPNPNGVTRLHRTGDEICFSIPAHRLVSMGAERIEAVLKPGETHVLVKHSRTVPPNQHREHSIEVDHGWVAIWRAKDGTQAMICVAWHQPGFSKGTSAWILEALILETGTARPNMGSVDRAEQIYGKPVELKMPAHD